MSTTATMKNQLLDCDYLLWIYPGYESGDETPLLNRKDYTVNDAMVNNKVTFMSGYGCCCTLTIAMIILLNQACKEYSQVESID